jgi:hypothetical protein
MYFSLEGQFNEIFKEYILLKINILLGIKQFYKLNWQMNILKGARYEDPADFESLFYCILILCRGGFCNTVLYD